MENIVITKSEEETFNYAKEIGKTAKEGSVFCLSGDLGAGKTVFAKGFCDGLGVCDYVNSPTFTIVNEYDGELHKVFHFDMYRIEDEDELIEIGYHEYLSSGGVVIIEWPQMIKNSLPKKRTEITITRDLLSGDNIRQIEIKEIG